MTKVMKRNTEAVDIVCQHKTKHYHFASSRVAKQNLLPDKRPKKNQIDHSVQDSQERERKIHNAYNRRMDGKEREKEISRTKASHSSSLFITLVK